MHGKIQIVDGSLGKKYLKEYTQEIYPIINEVLKSEISKAAEYGEVNKLMVDYFREIALKGKGIRSGLMNLSYLACGGSDVAAIKKASIFLEIFHTGLLVQDDYMDRSDSRRGMDSAHRYYAQVGKSNDVQIPYDHYGNTTAVNVGSYAYFLSWELLLNSDFSWEKIKKAADTYYESAKRLVFGEVQDLTITGNPDAKESDILNMLWIKSGDYSARMPMLIGAALAGQKDPKTLTALENYTKCLGWAFQIQDDLLGAFGDEKEVGKPIGGDFAEGKNTLLMLHLRKKGTPKQKAQVFNLAGHKDITRTQADGIRKILEDCGARKYVTDLGWRYVVEGKQYIQDITDKTDCADILESLLVFMMERTK